MLPGTIGHGFRKPSVQAGLADSIATPSSTPSDVPFTTPGGVAKSS
jgi:hypothetical protein